jgi:hypothetical protein
MMINYNVQWIFKCMKFFLEICRYVDNQKHDTNNILN